MLIPKLILFYIIYILKTKEIFNDFENEQLICLCVLKGGFKFFSNLLNSIQTKNRTSGTRSMPMMVDFIRLKSYHVLYIKLKL
jgi:hypoxanthine-guanine phosphoribosyltransferase